METWFNDTESAKWKYSRVVCRSADLPTINSPLSVLVFNECFFGYGSLRLKTGVKLHTRKHYVLTLTNKANIMYHISSETDTFDTIIRDQIFISTLVRYIHRKRGPRWHSDYGAVLQIGRSLVRSQLVSLEIFIDIKLPIAL